MRADGSIPYFDSIAEEYFAKYAEDSPGGYAFRERQTRVRELLADTGGSVLDVECGPGIMVEDILNWDVTSGELMDRPR
jgi:hypothetical protein